MRLIVIVVSVFVSCFAFGQSATKADDLFNKKDYLQAGLIYEELLKKRPSDQLFNYRYARCSYELKEYETAIQHFLKSGTRYPLRDYYLADSYFWVYKFNEALTYFNAFAESATVNPAFMSDVDDKIRRSTIAARLLNRVEAIKITDSIVVAKKDFLSVYELSKETGTLQQNPVYKEGHGWFDLISFTTQRGDRKVLSDTTVHSINLYTSNKLLDGWSRPERLSDQVNTEANENYPFLMLDGLTLFYASDGAGSIGGYDIFVTRFSGVSNDYLNPDNAGMPFNSLANDYMLVIDEQNQAGWFVSDRFQPRNKVAVYRFVYTGEKIYLTNDSTAAFIEAATLRTINWAEDQLATKRKVVEQKETTDQPDHQFYITDNLVYTKTEQFKSPLAQTKFTDWVQLTGELVKSEEKLKSLRHSYNTVAEDIERVTLSREMLAMEREVIRVRRQLEESEKNIRNEEIKYLKKSDVL